MGIDQIASLGGTKPSAIFLDRDGVINRNVFNPESNAYESPLTPEQVQIHMGVVDALLSLQRAGFLLIVVSNQPNYAKGKTTLATLEAIHRRIMEQLEPAGIHFTAVHYCLHHPQGIITEYSGPCDCRKPSPYFLLEDEKKFAIDLKRSWMVGDRDADVRCGQAAGVRTIRVQEDYPATRDPNDAPADYEAADLATAAAIILQAE